MSGTAQGLEEQCRQVADSANSAVQWLRAVGPRLADRLPPGAAQSAGEDLRRIGAQAGRLRQLTAPAVNVAIFGSGQSGKSYLAAALTRRSAAPLRVLFGEERVDYFNQINPLRSPKASSCVTRFTLHRPPLAFPGLPVALRLLSQRDVFCIIANSYLEDVAREAAAPAAPQRLAAVLNRLHAQPVLEPGGLSADEVWAMRAYFLTSFGDHPVVQALDDNYWTAAAELGPRLSIQGRAVLFSSLWGEIPQLTVMCVRLLQVLEALGNTDQAFCGLDALSPGLPSIIDSETLMQSLEDDASARIVVGTPDGRTMDVTRGMVAALTAELHLTLEEPGSAFLNNADLLDFPGAPARSRFDEPESMFADPTNRARHFRRGKAAYLFQRRAADGEISALVLCMEDTPPTARSMPTMVREWIDIAQGVTPDDRRDMPCALFVGLSKFDQELKEELRQREDDPEHWENRLRLVFDNFLCRDFRWAERWTPGRPFNNVYWLRNPVIPEPEVFQYNAAGRETGLVDRGRIARMRGRYLATPAIKQHFADPARAWDEVLKLNDGGVSFLAGQLRAVADPEQRRQYVAETLATLVRDMHHCLAPFHAAITPARPAPEPAPTEPAPTEPAAVEMDAQPEAAPVPQAEPIPVEPDGVEEPELIAQPPRPEATEPTGPALTMPAIEPAPVLAEGGTDRSRLLMMAAAGLVGLAILAGSAYWIFAGGGNSKSPPAIPAPSAAETKPSAPAATQATDAASEPRKAPEPAKLPEPAEADAKPKQDDPAKAEDTSQEGDPSKASGQPPATTR